MPRKIRSAAERIHGLYERRGAGECWPWTGALDGKGYGRMRDDKAILRAGTRIMWETVNGPIPPGMNLLHRCDNRPCVNPAHLFLGSSKENTLDMHEKNRGRAKLTTDDVLNIRKLWAARELKQSEIADRYGVKEPCIQRIATRRTWSWL